MAASRSSRRGWCLGVASSSRAGPRPCSRPFFPAELLVLGESGRVGSLSFRGVPGSFPGPGHSLDPVNIGGASATVSLPSIYQQHLRDGITAADASRGPHRREHAPPPGAGGEIPTSTVHAVLDGDRSPVIVAAVPATSRRPSSCSPAWSPSALLADVPRGQSPGASPSRPY